MPFVDNEFVLYDGPGASTMERFATISMQSEKRLSPRSNLISRAMCDLVGLGFAALVVVVTLRPFGDLGLGLNVDMMKGSTNNKNNARVELSKEM